MSELPLGEPIAGTENLYAWGEGFILKFYGQGTPEGWVEHIGKVDRTLFEAGLPVPGVGEIIEIEGGLGQVYERIEGDTMADQLFGSPELADAAVRQLARIFAELHTQIHTYGAIAGMPYQRQLLPAVIERTADLPADLKAATLRAFDKMPDGERLCHGDFHPYNVIMSPRGPIVIDWNNAHIGNPLEDVARSTLMLAGVGMSSGDTSAQVNLFDEAYLERTFQLRPGVRQQVVAWGPIVAAVRLSDKIPELETWLLEQIRSGLC